MSDAIQADQTFPDIDPRYGLMFAVAEQLIPLFALGSIDTGLARRMAVSAIEAYEPQTRADYVNVARTIAFSMSALALLGQAAAQDMTIPQKLRVFGRANALNRSADQSERTMMQRRRCHQSSQSAEQPTQSPEPPAPDPVLDDAAVQAAIVEAMRIYAACNPVKTDTTSLETTPTAETMPTAAPKSATPRPEPAVSIVQPPATVPASAIRYAGPTPDAGQTRTIPYKEGLLQHSAMQRIAGQTALSHPV